MRQLSIVLARLQIVVLGAGGRRRQKAVQAASRACISVTQRPILRFFAPQGRHAAPMGVKFGMEEGTEVPSSMTNFTLIGAACRPCGAKNLKIGL